jgi:hypothetical protein
VPGPRYPTMQVLEVLKQMAVERLPEGCNLQALLTEMMLLAADNVTYREMLRRLAS